MNTCKSCKWWVVNNEHEDELRTCEQPKAIIGYRWNPADMPTDGVWIENDEGWAWFTGPDFGCVNWEKKE